MITGAAFAQSSGQLIAGGSEALTLLDPSTAPWEVTVDGVPAPVSGVSESGGVLLLTLDPQMATEVLLSYAGGAFVEGAVSGLPLQAVTEFPVTVT